MSGGWREGQPLRDCTWPPGLVAGIAIATVVTIGCGMIAAALTL